MKLQDIEQLLRNQPGLPPVERWQPPLSGDMDMRIDVRGDWYHEGGRIARPALVNLFASILRREADGQHYLVTPVEKWRIQVEDAPLLAIDMEVAGSGEAQRIVFVLNTERLIALDADHPLTVGGQDRGEPRPYLQLERGLRARLSRALFYRLVDLARERGGELQVLSAGVWFTLGRCD